MVRRERCALNKVLPGMQLAASRECFLEGSPGAVVLVRQGTNTSTAHQQSGRRLRMTREKLEFDQSLIV